MRRKYRYRIVQVNECYYVQRKVSVVGLSLGWKTTSMYTHIDTARAGVKYWALQDSPAIQIIETYEENDLCKLLR